MMARATRSTTAELKRKRSPDNVDNVNNAPNKLPKTDDEPDDPKETEIDCNSILSVLEAEDTQDLLSRVFDNQESLRSLLSTTTRVSVLRAAINRLRPISSSRAKPSETAADQQRFCNLALSLVEQVSPSTTDHLQKSELPAPSSPQRITHRQYALVQHLPSGDWWSSASSAIQDPAVLHTAHAELVSILPTPSTSSTDKPQPTLGSYCPRPAAPKKYILPNRRVSTGAFLDYGAYTSFAPSFDQDGQVLGRRDLADVLWYRHEKKRLREQLRTVHRHATVVDVDVTTVEEEKEKEKLDQQYHHHHRQARESADSLAEVPDDDDLEALLGPEEVDSINAALKSLELENSVQQLLRRNQRALVRLGELQKLRLMKHPVSPAEEGSEEWDTAQAILDSLALLASLRPRSSSSSSSEDDQNIIPSPSILRKLQRTLAIEPSPSWTGTLPTGRTTVLRDDSTVKIRAGATISNAAATTATGSTTTTPVPVSSSTITNTASSSSTAANPYGNYPYAYASQQQQAYRAQAANAAAYTPYKPGQTSSYYPNYSAQQQGYYAQQSYATAIANQQPYGAAAGQQPYAGYNWFGQYASLQGGAAGAAALAAAASSSGRGTPQPLNVNLPATYGSFFNAATIAAAAANASTNATATPTTTTAAAAAAAASARTPAVANTVVSTSTPSAAGATSSGTAAAAAGMVPTLPNHLRPTVTVMTNGTTMSYQNQTPTLTSTQAGT